MNRTHYTLGTGLLIATATSIHAAQVDVTIANLQPAGGFAFTPVWLGFHDNTFDVFNAGNAASTLAGITEIAELGDSDVLSGRFATAQADGFDTTFADASGPPVFSPGESSTQSFDIGDATRNRYFNFASMVVPSNDLFVGNDEALQIFDAAGTFLGPVTIDIFGSNVWDNGSEVNDIADGPAFVQGIDATLGTDENSTIRAFLTQPEDSAYLASIIGTITVPGAVVSEPFTADALIGRITITPEPSTLAIFAVGTVLLRPRRRA